MNRTLFSAEVTESQAALLQRMVAFLEELDQLALTAPDGTVFDACELAVIDRGREIQQKMLEDAVARRIESAEKRGCRSGSVRVAEPKKIEAPKLDSWSARSE